MVNRELREWLGLTWADLLVYLAVAAAVALFLVKDTMPEVALAAVGIVMAIAACPLGMTRDPAVSGFTNTVKFVSYPLLRDVSSGGRGRALRLVQPVKARRTRCCT